MKTTEERAKDYAEIAKIRGDMPLELAEDVYIEIATEQKAIDIEEAWQWMVDWVFENAPHEVFDELMSSREEYVKAMEE